jgi:hypothetical protein
VEVSVQQACDILRTWQANRSWVAVALEDNLGLVNCGGFLRAVELDRFELSDAQGSVVRLSLTLERSAEYRYCVGGKETDDQPYETLEIRVNQCLAYLGAFEVQPKRFRSML